jgi:hypothetical protein
VGELVQKSLWKYGLDLLVQMVAESTHSLDRDRVRNLARDMRMVGEQPTYQEMRTYVGELWDGWPHAANMVRDTWRSVYKTKTSVGRNRGGRAKPLYYARLLIEKHGLRPSLESRVAAVARAAADALVEAASASDAAAYSQREKELHAAVTAIRHLRHRRQEPAPQLTL